MKRRKTLRRCLLLLLAALVLAGCGVRSAAVPTSTAVPSDAPTPEPAAATPVPRELTLVNARVEGQERLLLTAEMEGAYLARAVLPEGMLVDHWEIDGETVDPGHRRFSLAFSSEGVERVEAVLRPERTVDCGEHAYLQFLDENGLPAGTAFRSLSFETAYESPVTGQNCLGGQIWAYVTPIVPPGQELEAWIVNGERVAAETAARGIRLEGLDRAVQIRAVLREGDRRVPQGEILTLGGEDDEAAIFPADLARALPEAADGAAGEAAADSAEDAAPAPAPTAVPVPADDLPDGETVPRTASPWIPVEAETTGSIADPTGQAPDGHYHVWKLREQSPGDCQEPVLSLYRCAYCKEELWKWEAGEHAYSWINAGDYHYQECDLCEALGRTAEHNFGWCHNKEEHYMECAVCRGEIGRGAHVWFTAVPGGYSYCRICHCYREGF